MSNSRKHARSAHRHRENARVIDAAGRQENADTYQKADREKAVEMDDAIARAVQQTATQLKAQVAAIQSESGTRQAVQPESGTRQQTAVRSEAAPQQTTVKSETVPQQTEKGPDRTGFSPAAKKSTRSDSVRLEGVHPDGVHSDASRQKESLADAGVQSQTAADPAVGVQSQTAADPAVRPKKQKRTAPNERRMKAGEKNPGRRLTKLGVVGNVLLILFAFLSMLISRSAAWVLKTWNHLSMEELMFQLKSPIEGTNSDMIADYAKYTIPLVAGLLLLFILLFVLLRRRGKYLYRGIRIATFTSMALLLGVSVMHFWKTLDIGAYVRNQNTDSHFIDNNYVDPGKVNMTFPEKKRNLIYIYLESMENTFSDKKSGGAFDEDVIPELTQLSLENEDFRGDSDTLNGGIPMQGGTWTMGAMFSQTSGLPLLIPSGQNTMDQQDSFFPTITTLGDILEDQGYKQAFLLGSDATFGGRRKYFTSHGQYDMWDLDYAHQTGLVPADHKVWWGYEDYYLFDIAQTKLQELSKSDQPFNLTMLTVDTHFEDGYVCKDCGDKFDTQYSNVYACSSKKVSDFVHWVQQQPFYENTTIIISGDHCTMDKDYCNDVPSSYQRKVLTTYINAAAKRATNDRREYATLDELPTTLAGLGVQIEGNRLGLGTNLFSSTPTLVEKYGVDEVNTELTRHSKLMDKLTSDLKSDEQLAEESEKQKAAAADQTDPDQAAADQEGTNQAPNDQAAADPNATDQTQTDQATADQAAANQANANQSAANQAITDPNQIPADWQSHLGTAVSAVDPATNTFTITMTGIPQALNAQALRCAIWPASDRTKLLWYECQRQADGSYVAQISAAAYTASPGAYRMEAYLLQADGTSVTVGSTDINF